MTYPIWLTRLRTMRYILAPTLRLALIQAALFEKRKLKK
jgi:hypothetical protein